VDLNLERCVRPAAFDYPASIADAEGTHQTSVDHRLDLPSTRSTDDSRIDERNRAA
jgi:hypothetical protein